MEQYMELLSVLAGFVGVPIVNSLKRMLGWDGRAALLITGLVSGVLAVGALFLTGQLTIESFTLDALVASITLIFTTAQIIYRLLEG